MEWEDIAISGTDSAKLPVVTMTNGLTIRLVDPYDMDNAKKYVKQLMPTIENLKWNGFETIVVPATKPIPIAWHFALAFNLNLVVLKKEQKPYSEVYKTFECQSITSSAPNTMFITRRDYENINGKKIIFFDDVISSGATYEAAKKFITVDCGSSEIRSLFIFKEGDAYKEGKEVTYLGKLPF